MQATLHFTQVDIQAEIADRVARISQELATLRRDGDLQVDISPQDLFYLEALGYLVDFSTGLLVCNSERSLATLGT
ncbi:MAG: hypothetical protein H6642_19170 [Caldilineaceae bacterium]|nr:hypothetical protein [Caldilineaceae bacterium]